MNNTDNSSKNEKTINAFDILIPLIILVCILTVILRSCMSSENVNSTYDDVSLYFTIEKTSKEVINAVNEASSVYFMNNEKEVLLGVTSDNNIEDLNSIFRIDNYSEQVEDENGNHITVFYPDNTKYTAKGMLNCNGSYDTDKGFLLNGSVHLTKGQELKVYTEKACFVITITEIQP